MDYTKIENLAEFKKEEKLLSDCFAKRAACVNKVLLLNEGNVNLTAGEETSELDGDERAPSGRWRPAAPRARSSA